MKSVSIFTITIYFCCLSIKLIFGHEYVYIGCFQGDITRDVGKRFKSPAFCSAQIKGPICRHNGALMPTCDCVNFCLRQNFSLAGIQSGDHCFCWHKNDVDSKHLIEDQRCFYCSQRNKGRERCGGILEVSVFMLKHDEFYLGCYSAAKLQILPKFQKQNQTSMSPAYCGEICKGHKYGLAGIQNSYECWCGNYTYFEDKRMRADGECTEICVGNQNRTCGGNKRISVYTTTLASPGSTCTLDKPTLISTNERTTAITSILTVKRGKTSSQHVTTEYHISAAKRELSTYQLTTTSSLNVDTSFTPTTNFSSRPSTEATISTDTISSQFKSYSSISSDIHSGSTQKIFHGFRQFTSVINVGIHVGHTTTEAQFINCNCSCKILSKWAKLLDSNISKSEISALMLKETDEIRKNTRVTKNETGAYKRLKICARDDRPSSATIGYSGALIIVSIPCFCLLFDCLNLFNVGWKRNQIK